MAVPKEPKDFPAHIMTALKGKNYDEANRLRGELFLAKLDRLTAGMSTLTDEQRHRAVLLLGRS